VLLRKETDRTMSHSPVQFYMLLSITAVL